MSFKKEGAYAGIEDHVPRHKLPPLPLGQHAVEVSRAHRFEARSGKETTVIEATILISEDAPDCVGKTYSTAMTFEKPTPGYYLADVREFVSAALGMDIARVNADVAAEAINERDEAPGTATGARVGVRVLPNEKDSRYPHVTFVSLH